MTSWNGDPIEEARRAFHAGEFNRGGRLLHQILQHDILYEDAWLILYRYLGKDLSYHTFQRQFTEKYYPEQLEQLIFAQQGTLDAPPAPFRRVSLLSDNDVPHEMDHVDQLEYSIPKAAPLPQPRRIEKITRSTPSAVLKKLFGRRAKRRPPEKDTGSPPARAKRSSWLRQITDRFQKLFARRKIRSPRRLKTVSSKGDPAEEAPDSSTSAIDRGLSLLSLNKPNHDAENENVGLNDAKSDAIGRTLVHSLGERKEIRLLIADDIDHTREMIVKLLQFEPSVEVVGAARNGREAVRMAAELEPDIILLDINMPDMDGLQALHQIHSRLPLAQVIMLTVQDDPSYLREALQAGARDYLIKPPMIDDLLDTIHKANEIGSSERERLESFARPPEVLDHMLPSGSSGQVVAVFSPKGGVGCTMIAANLAATLQSDRTPVVLLDCDLKFGTVGLFFNEFARDSIADLAANPEELDRTRIMNSAVYHAETGVRLLLAQNSSGKATRVTGRQIADLILQLRNAFAYIVVDMSSTIDDVTLSVMEAADQVLLVTTQDIPSINDVRKLLDLAPRAGIEPFKISLVLNQYHPRVKISPEQIATNLRVTFASVIPLDRQIATASINRGLPFMSDPRIHDRPIGSSIRELADQVVRSGQSEAAVNSA